MIKNYFNAWSTNQRITGVVGILVVVALIAFAMVQGKSKLDIDEANITINMPIKAIAPTLKVTGQSLAKELNLPLDVNKKLPLIQQGISENQLEEVVHHLAGHTDSNAKYIVYAALALWGWLFLVILGRPKQFSGQDRRTWYPTLLYTIALIASVTLVGFYFGKSPNPMEGIVKVFKSMVGLYPDPMMKLAALMFFLLLVVVGNKLICGWGCPFGALQELIYKLPLFKTIKTKKMSFSVTNTIRSLLFVTVLFVLFGWIGNHKGLVLYHYLNPFNLFNLDFESITILVSVIIFLLASFFVYRPFCSLICPFGFVSWLVELLSFYRLRVDPNKCTQCMACVKACPTLATKNKVEKKWWAPDCYSCTRCLNVCNADAIEYTSVFKK